jgi:hypothetical protein
MTGYENGSMRLRVTFSRTALVMGRKPEPTRVLFDRAADGKPKSYGFAEYNGKRLNVSDMSAD